MTSLMITTEVGYDLQLDCFSSRRVLVDLREMQRMKSCRGRAEMEKREWWCVVEHGVVDMRRLLFSPSLPSRLIVVGSGEPERSTKALPTTEHHSTLSQQNREREPLLIIRLINEASLNRVK